MTKNKMLPYFELDGITYEIKRTNYLTIEYNKQFKRKGLDVETASVANLVQRVKKYAQKLEELESVYFETLLEEDRQKYLSMRSLYDEAYSQLLNEEKNSKTIEKITQENINLLEELAIKALSEQYFNMDFEKGKELWERYVDLVGQNDAIEWLNAMNDCLFDNEEEKGNSNSFLSQMRARKKK